MSFLLSTTLAVLLFAAMQLYKVHLASHEWTTIGGGFLGSLLFLLILTVSSDSKMIRCQHQKSSFCKIKINQKK